MPEPEQTQTQTQPVALEPEKPRPVVGANAWGWTPWGMPMAFGMALHRRDDPRGGGWSNPNPIEQIRDERRYPDNQFVQNAREADFLVGLYWLSRSFPCHDRPEEFVRMSGAYGRPVGALTHPHAMWAMMEDD